MLLRRIHRNALSWVNEERALAGLDPIGDFPTGFRGGDANPITNALGSHEREVAPKLDEAIKEAEADPLGAALEAAVIPSPMSAFFWFALFTVGFYPKYDQAKMYERLPPKRRALVARRLRNLPSDARERYYRVEQVVKMLKE